MLNLGPIKIPSKTFIIGEYLALQGTASMIMTTEPCFEFLPVQDGGELFHPESPAGMLSKKLET